MRHRLAIQATFISTLLLLITLVPAERADAQWGVGASYETRNEHPENGFGLRIERGILQTVPVVDISLRAHFSTFNESVESYEDAGVPAELDSYDFGLAALGGVNLGLLTPYAGFGFGSESFEAVRQGAQEESFDDSSLYWNVFTGASFTMLPVVKPFIEYRFSRMFDDEELMYNQNARWAFGVLLEF